MSKSVSSVLLSLLTEARRAELPYTEKKTKGAIDKVIVELSGTHSAKFTRIAKQYKELKDQSAALQEKMNDLNAEIKDNAIDLFDAADEVYTRIVETASMTILIGKRQPDQIETISKTDYDAVVQDIMQMVPELTDKIKELIDAHTEVEEKLKVAKAPQLRVDLKEDVSLASIIKFLKAKAKKVLQSIKSWSRSYDSRLASIKLKLNSK